MDAIRKKKRTGPRFKKASLQSQIEAGAVGCGCHISSRLAPSGRTKTSQTEKPHRRHDLMGPPLLISQAYSYE